MNKENAGDKPSRSILKNDSTLPLLPLNDRLNRRVSFHPEVTLHKIDFVPVPMDKRRETIAIIPSSRDSSDSGDLVDAGGKSSSDERSISTDDEIQGSQEQNEKIEEKHADESNSVGDDSDDDLANGCIEVEETMEFTGQFVSQNKAATPTAHESNSQSHGVQNNTESVHNVEPINSPPLSFMYDGDDGEMEFTANVGMNLQKTGPTDQAANPVPEQLQETGDSNNNNGELDSFHPHNLDIDDFYRPSIPRLNKEHDNQENSSVDHYSIQINDDQAQQHYLQPDDNDLEETMDMTKLYAHANMGPQLYPENDPINEEMTMDMTKLYQVDQTFAQPIEATTTNKQGEQADDSSFKMSGNESIMEFTQEVSKIKIADKIEDKVIQDTNNSPEAIVEEEVESGASKQYADEVGKAENQRSIEEAKDQPGLDKQYDKDQKEDKSENMAEDQKADKSENLAEEQQEDKPDNLAKEQPKGSVENDQEEEMTLNKDDINEEPINEPSAEIQDLNEMDATDAIDARIETNQLIVDDKQDVQDMDLTHIEHSKQELMPGSPDFIDNPEHQSQKMQLTQEYGDIKQVQKKRKSEPRSPEVPRKYPKINNSAVNKTITTIIPLADISTESINDYDAELDDNYSPVSLNEFLKDIGIRFYDDLEIGAKSVDRISISLPKLNEEQMFKLDEFVSAMNKMPLLELYDFSCKELSKNIKDGKVVFDQFNEFTMETNPRLFKQYYQCNPNDKLSMKSEFQLIKDYTRQQAKEVWYGWRIQLIQNLIIQLDEKLENHIQDKETLLKNISSITEIFELLKVKFDNLSNQLNQLLQIENQCNALNPDELLALKNELLTINQQFKETNDQQNSQGKDLNELNLAISENKNIIESLNSEITDVERTINNNKTYEISEIETLNLKFNFLQAFTNLTYTKMSGNKIEFVFHGIVDIAMDFSDINDLSNISYLLNNNSPGSFKNEFITSSISTKLSSLASGNSIIESFQSFKKSWSFLQKIDTDIYKISLKFPIVLIETTSNEMRFKIRYYCGKLNFKINIFVSIDLSNLLDYPKNIQIQGHFVRSENQLTKQMVLEHFFDDCISNTLISSEDHFAIEGL